MTRRAYIYFILTFSLGVVVGGAGLFSYAWYWGHWHQRFDKDRIIRHLKSDLSLTDAQVAQVTPIVEDWDKKQADLHARTDPQFQALREDFRNRVRQVLNPDQLPKFNELLKRHDERLMRQRKQ